MRLIVWLIRAFIFFALFAFALNNQHAITVEGVFGWRWQAPVAWVVLIAFALGAGLGVLAMLPAWWRASNRGETARPSVPPDSQAPPVPSAGKALHETASQQPPRLGL
jgi:uncharacterized integral membrane protein